MPNTGENQAVVIGEATRLTAGAMWTIAAALVAMALAGTKVAMLAQRMDDRVSALEASVYSIACKQDPNNCASLPRPVP